MSYPERGLLRFKYVARHHTVSGRQCFQERWGCTIEVVPRSRSGRQRKLPLVPRHESVGLSPRERSRSIRHKGPRRMQTPMTCNFGSSLYRPDILGLYNTSHMDN